MQRTLRILKFILLPSTWVHFVRLFDSAIHNQLLARRLITFEGDATIDSSASFRNGARITLGNRVFVNFMCSIWAGPASRIKIGADTILGPYVHINSTNHSFARRDVPILAQGYVQEDIEIGSNVWIGAHSVVLAGSRIGDGAVIGANSVVRGVIPAYSIAVGSPARVVKERPA
ncbi:MAG: transferase hexapeptide repeat containing protein [Fibrobacteres bacterium]|nr:transferase hexapeptide repeat containing protein [Fibrobacterota bacterium]